MKKHVLDRLWIHLIVVIASGLLYVSCQKEENHILPEEESTSSEINRQAAPDDEDVDINELVEWVSNTPIEPQDIDNIFGELNWNRALVFGRNIIDIPIEQTAGLDEEKWRTMLTATLNINTLQDIYIIITPRVIEGNSFHEYIFTPDGEFLYEISIEDGLITEVNAPVQLHSYNSITCKICKGIGDNCQHDKNDGEFWSRRRYCDTIPGLMPKRPVGCMSPITGDGVVEDTDQGPPPIETPADGIYNDGKKYYYTRSLLKRGLKKKYTIGSIDEIKEGIVVEWYDIDTDEEIEDKPEPQDPIDDPGSEDNSEGGYEDDSGDENS